MPSVPFDAGSTAFLFDGKPTILRRSHFSFEFSSRLDPKPDPTRTKPFCGTHSLQLWKRIHGVISSIVHLSALPFLLHPRHFWNINNLEI